MVEQRTMINNSDHGGTEDQSLTQRSSCMINQMMDGTGAVPNIMIINPNLNFNDKVELENLLFFFNDFFRLQYRPLSCIRHNMVSWSEHIFTI